MQWLVNKSPGGKDKNPKSEQNICKIFFCGQHKIVIGWKLTFLNHKSENPGFLFLSFQADDEGCFTQLVNAKSLQLKQKGYESTLQVEAKVREEGTGLYYY